MNEQLDPLLLQVLACPLEHHTKLEYDPAAAQLRCPTCQAVYPVTDGIPVLLPPAAASPAESAEQHG